MAMERLDDQNRQTRQASLYGRTTDDVASSHVVIEKYSYLQYILHQGLDIIYH